MVKTLVIIPTYNRKDALRRCLAAVTNQDYPDYEVIVVDDGSTDGTEDMVRREFPQAYYLRQQPNRGPAAARNRGIDAASGELLWQYTNTADGGGSFNPYGVAVADGIVYASTKNLSGTNYPNGMVYAVDAANGTLRWIKEAPRQTNGYNSYVATPVVVEEGVAYFTLSGIGLVAADAHSGQTIWQSAIGSTHYNGAAVLSGKLYQASGWLYCLDTSDGSTNWKVYLAGYCDSTPAVANGKVYICRGSPGPVNVHDAETGDLLWATTNLSLIHI